MVSPDLPSSSLFHRRHWCSTHKVKNRPLHCRPWTASAASPLVTPAMSCSPHSLPPHAPIACLSPSQSLLQACFSPNGSRSPVSSIRGFHNFTLQGSVGSVFIHSVKSYPHLQCSLFDSRACITLMPFPVFSASSPPWRACVLDSLVFSSQHSPTTYNLLFPSASPRAT